MKTKAFLNGGLAIALALIAFSAHAKVPEPDTVLCGTLSKVGGMIVKSTDDQVIQVQALVNGSVLATADLSCSTNTFVLRIPMDDGVAPRIAGTAKSSDLVNVRVVNLADGTEIETVETQTSAIEIPEDRGSVIAVDFKVDGAILGPDQDADGIPDEWEQQYAVSSFAGVKALSLAADDSKLDNDGDGFSNFEEYVAGTDPLDKSSTFSVKNLTVSADVVSVTFGPATADRLYSLLYKTTLGEKDWSVVDQYRPIETEESVVWEVEPQQSGGGFYKLSVEKLQ